MPYGEKAGRTDNPSRVCRLAMTSVAGRDVGTL
jgi:hypothetical protein